MSALIVPELSLVVLAGPSGAGKSTFAARHFGPYEVLSSDHFRGVVSGDPTDQAATADAFRALEAIAEIRLERGLLTVIDATNTTAFARKRWVELARRFHVIPVAIALDVPPELAAERNAARPDRDFGEHVCRRQSRELRAGLRGLSKEGFRYAYTLGPDAIDAAAIERPRPWTDRRDERGPFDIVGDVHGCADELFALLAELGWSVAEEEGRFRASHPAGRKLVFLGDLVDRGPDSPTVLRLVMDLVEAGAAICVPGNHEARLQRWLEGRNVKLTHGLDATVAQLEGTEPAFRARVQRFIEKLVSHFVLDDGRLVVAHAGMRAELAGRASGKVRQFALYGETTGEIDEYGLPVRTRWAEDYRGRAAVVYGHTPVPWAEWVNGTICVDTGCVFGGELTALRWPERELVSVPAARVYCEPIRPLHAVDSRSGQAIADDLLDVGDALGGRRVETRLRMSVPVPAERAAPAMEVLARFAVDPRWLIHLPPTMSPSETSARPGLLEHPDEAFAYYRKNGVERVVCETKHMGSRALVVLGRSPEAVAARFGFAEPPAAGGHVLTRRGRAFFEEDSLTAALLARVRAAADAAGLWERLETDWVLIDAELMPWSAKARALLETQYGPVGTAGRTSLAATAQLLERAGARQDVGELLGRTRARLDAVERFARAWRGYCWDVAGVDDLRLAPFHLLASEGRVHADRDHRWHLETLAELVDPVIRPTEWREVEIADAAACAEAVAWWEAHTAAGGEGLVVKPASFLAWRKGRLLQPALKCRGPEYLRLIYGPEYPLHLDRLRDRGVARKRALAVQELALGLEALERFVAREPLRRVHAPILGLLALESEPVDPRL